MALPLQQTNPLINFYIEAKFLNYELISDRIQGNNARLPW